MRTYKMWWMTSDVGADVSVAAMSKHFPDEGTRQVWEDISMYQTIVAMSDDLDLSHLFEMVDHRSVVEILSLPEEASSKEVVAVLPDGCAVVKYTYKISTLDFNDTYEKYYVKEI